MTRKDVLKKAYELSTGFLDELPNRPVGRPVEFSALLEKLGGPLPEHGEDPLRVVENLYANADPGVVATAGPRYFGFVIGGAQPAALAADWLAAVWDQNAFAFVMSPAAAVVEEVIRTWLIDLLNLPSDMSLGLTTGATLANFTALAAARHALLKKAGWDVERNGLRGAPDVPIITSAESHITVFGVLQMLGLGRDQAIKVPTDDQGRMRADKLRAVLSAVTAPPLVCAQAGNVNTGACDPLAEIAALVRERGGWLHVGGAFGMWAAASPAHRALVKGIELADSIGTDCHKWLNVPLDSGLILIRDCEAHRDSMTLNAPYYVPSPEPTRENGNWVAESSRRARGFAVYAALRALGRDGIAGIVDRCCRLARRMADRLAQGPGVQILNDVVLNQVLVRFSPPDGGAPDAFTKAVIRRIQEDGTCWAGGTIWHEMHALRISISNWSTTEADIDASAAAILKCARDAAGTSHA